MRHILVLLLLLTLTACGSYGPVRATDPEINALAAQIRALSPGVDPQEAQDAARIAFRTSHSLAIAYEITDPPLVHNVKVNAGRKPRGLCYHWAEDLQARLELEEFATLEIQRAIANADSAILIDHSTAVITARGATMESGVVIDPWRYGGRLFWSPVLADQRYDWRLREDVLREKGRIIYAHRTAGSLAAPPAE